MLTPLNPLKWHFYLLLFLLFISIVCTETSTRQYHYNHKSNNYYTLKLDSTQTPLELAKRYNLSYVGPVGELKDYHLFLRNKQINLNKDPLHSLLYKTNKSKRSQLENNGISEFNLQVPKLRVKRGPVGKGRPSKVKELNMTRYALLGIRDPGFPKQWHFHNQEDEGNDLNITKLWEEGITGKGVIVAIVDDGIDYEHRDIKENFFAEGSYDFNDERPLPMPMLDEDTHGTRCAGQIAGIRNNDCGVGIAYESKVSGIRVLSKEITDDAEAIAINYKYQINQIYSCSWGPPDDGLAMDRPPKIVEEAIKNGAENGRQKKGSIFVFASGNGGINGDNCNFDGYTNSIYSITVGSVDAKNQHPAYSEACTAMMITAYSSGNFGARIYTSSSWHSQCTDSHGGTSAAAPMMAGIIALALQKRPDLTWRDFQHISVQAAVPVNLQDESWSKTWMGRWYSPKYGYGKVDGYKYVHHAMNFTSKNQQTKLTTPTVMVQQRIPQDHEGILSSTVIKKEDLNNGKFKSLEHVTVTVNIIHNRRSDIAIDLISPNGIVSEICVPRLKDNSDQGFPNWTFMTVKHWDEPAEGEWKLRVKDIKDPFAIGDFISWHMTLYGDSTIPLENDNNDRPTIIHQDNKKEEEKVIISEVNGEIPSKVTSYVLPSNITSSVESMKDVFLTKTITLDKAETALTKESIESNVVPTATEDGKQAPVNTEKVINQGNGKLKEEEQKNKEQYNSQLLSQLNSLGQGQNSFMIYVILLLCFIVLIVLSIMLFYRYKNQPFRDQQMREMSLLNDEEHDYQLQELDDEDDDNDEHYHDDEGGDIKEEDANVSTDVLYIAEDEDELLLDVDNDQTDENRSSTDGVRSLE
ncbi:hypothetical protein K502DRAFT_303343 [Neoconidiobolus thromboides FSU 785]|nr:hypothetical protein K502DRAFT_303343 [Neoconidiobolus thromboides FSU 785]